MRRPRGARAAPPRRHAGPRGRPAHRLTQAIPWVALGDIWSGHWPRRRGQLAEGLELARGTSQHQIEAHLIAIQAMLAAVRGDEARCRSFAADSLQRASERRLIHVSCCATWALAVLELGLGVPRPRSRTPGRYPRPPASTGTRWTASRRRCARAKARPRNAWLEAFEPWARSSERAVGPGGGAATATGCCPRTPPTPSACSRPPWRCTSTRAPVRACSHRAGLRRVPAPRAPSRRRADPPARRARALRGARIALWAERARAELRATGETARKRDPSTLDQLTAQEVQIAQLVAEGRTNRDVAGSSSSARARSTTTCATSFASSTSRRAPSWRGSTLHAPRRTLDASARATA